MDRGVKKLAWCGVVLLTTGMLISIAVAWGCAIWSPVKQVIHPTKLAENSWPVNVAAPDGAVGYYTVLRGPGVVYWSGLIARGAEGEFSYFKARVELNTRAGLPLHCLESRVRAFTDEQGFQPTRWDLPLRVIVMRGPQTDTLWDFLHAQPGRRIPLVPRPLALAVNTLFWGAVVGLGWWALRSLGKTAESA